MIRKSTMILAMMGAMLMGMVAQASASSHYTAVDKLTYALLAHGGSDAAQRIYYSAGSDWIKEQMQLGAYRYCDSGVYEDFSCK